MKTFTKQPNDHLDYDLVFDDWLPEGDTIIDVNVVAPAGIQVTATSIEDSSVKIWIDGGTTGEVYKFSPVITTFAGREKEVDFIIKVKDF